MSSVDDLALWDAALSSGKLMKPETRDRMFANRTLKDGRKTNYGYGWQLATYEGRTIQQHGGINAAGVQRKAQSGRQSRCSRRLPR